MRQVTHNLAWTATSLASFHLFIKMPTCVKSIVANEMSVTLPHTFEIEFIKDLAPNLRAIFFYVPYMPFFYQTKYHISPFEVIHVLKNEF